MKTDIQQQCDEVHNALFDLQIFFIKAHTKLTVFETISKAKIKIQNIDDMMDKIGSCVRLKEINAVRRRLLTLKKYLADLNNARTRCEKVFGSTNAAENWLRSEVMALDGKTPLEVMKSDKGIDRVLTELSHIEHGFVS